MYRKGVAAIIINSLGKFLLVNLHSMQEGFFTIPGGGIDEGESDEDAVYRELYEELGIDSKDLVLIGKSNIPLITNFITPKQGKNGEVIIGSEKTYFGFRFIGTDQDILSSSDEVRMCKWVSKNDLKNYLVFESQLEDTLQKIAELQI